MALPSQELLEKYRAEQKADQDKPANPEQSNAETTGTETETQPTGGEPQGNGEATTDTKPDSSDSNGAQPEESGKDDKRWERTQANFEKRLHRQERTTAGKSRNLKPRSQRCRNSWRPRIRN